MAQPGDGALSYTEFPVDDMTRARQFYERVFGWTSQDHPTMEYAFFDSPSGGMSGGFVARRPGTPASPVSYIICDDLDLTLVRLVDNGGSVAMARTPFGDLGWLAHATDTEGNLIGLWQTVDTAGEDDGDDT